MKSNPCNHTECQKHYRDVRLWDVWALIVYPVIVAVALVAAVLVILMDWPGWAGLLVGAGASLSLATFGPNYPRSHAWVAPEVADLSSADSGLNDWICQPRQSISLQIPSVGL